MASISPLSAMRRRRRQYSRTSLRVGRACCPRVAVVIGLPLLGRDSHIIPRFAFRFKNAIVLIGLKVVFAGEYEQGGGIIQYG